MTDREGRYADMRQDVARVATEALKAGRLPSDSIEEPNDKPFDIQAVLNYCLHRLDVAEREIIDLREKLKGLGGV